MTFTEWQMYYPLHDVDELECPMTRMEKIANNITTIVVARAAMIVTPLLLSFFVWLFWQMWQGIDGRVSDLEAGQSKQSSFIQDHEARLAFNQVQADTFKADARERFSDLNSALKDLVAQMGTVNGNIIRLQTTVENRLPPRTGSLETQP